MPSKATDLVEAARRVIDALPSSRIYIIGEGELQASLETRAAALHLGDRLVFCGFRRDVAQALAALDLLVFPSLWEGTPLTVLEALAMEKAIVSTDADGLEDVLTGGHDARMVPRRDAGALRRRIVGLARDPGRARAARRQRQTNRRAVRRQSSL